MQRRPAPVVFHVHHLAERLGVVVLGGAQFGSLSLDGLRGVTPNLTANTLMQVICTV
jgi:hypothetical protein